MLPPYPHSETFNHLGVSWWPPTSDLGLYLPGVRFDPWSGNWDLSSCIVQTKNKQKNFNHFWFLTPSSLISSAFLYRQLLTQTCPTTQSYCFTYMPGGLPHVGAMLAISRAEMIDTAHSNEHWSCTRSEHQLYPKKQTFLVAKSPSDSLPFLYLSHHYGILNKRNTFYTRSSINKKQIQRRLQ